MREFGGERRSGVFQSHVKLKKNLLTLKLTIMKKSQCTIRLE